MAIKMNEENVAKTLGLTECLKYGQLLNLGSFKKIMVPYSEKEQIFSEEISSKVKDTWKKHLESHPADFDGMLASIKLLKNKNGTLIIRTRKSWFSTFFSLRGERIPNYDITPIDKKNCVPLSVGAIAITADKKIVVAMRGETAFDEKVLTFLPGGYIDPSTDLIDGSISIPFCLKRELKEELGISDYKKPTYLGVVHSKKGSKQPLIAIRIQLLETSEKIHKIYKKDCESCQLYFIKDDIREMAKFLKGKKIAIHDAWKVILYFSSIAS